MFPSWQFVSLSLTRHVKIKTKATTDEQKNLDVFNDEPLAGMPLPERYIFEQVIFDHTWSCCDLWPFDLEI